MEEKGSSDRKKLAHSKWKAFFDSLVFLGGLLFIVKFMILALNYFAGINITIPEGLPKILSTVLPLALLIIGSVGSGRLKNK